jgi:hypothetical protein
MFAPAGVYGSELRAYPINTLSNAHLGEIWNDSESSDCAWVRKRVGGTAESWCEMATYRVDIESLHQQNIQQHLIPCDDNLSSGEVVLVPIHSTNRNSFSIDSQLTVVYLHRAKANRASSCLE